MGNKMEKPQSRMPPPPSADLLEIFQKYDKDQNGFITADELQSALSNGTWIPFNAETVHLMLSMFDKSNEGVISFEDFGALWKYIVDWKNCFRCFDKDNSGNMDINELRDALQTFGYIVSVDAVSAMSRKYDKTGKGTILFDDFILCCLRLEDITAVFRQIDTDEDGEITLSYDDFVGLAFGS